MKRGTSVLSRRSCHVEWQKHKDAAGCEETGRQTVWSVQGCQPSGTRGQSVELELPQRWRVHNLFHTTLIEPSRTSVRGLRDEPIAVTDSRYIDRHGVSHEVGYDVEGNQVLEDFAVEEIMGSHYNAERKKVLYLIKWKGYLEESEWTEEPLEHLPRTLVRSFHPCHPGAAKDDKLTRRARGG